MTIYRWSELAADLVIAFDPNADLFFFDDLSISARGLSTTGYLSGTAATFTANGKALTLHTDLKALTSTNITFADGSLYLLGDNSVGTMDDDGPNTLIGGTGDDQLFGFGGNDSLNGGAGADVAVYGGPLADYHFSLSGGHVLITDTNTANGDDGADQLVSVEAAQFSDGTIKIGSVAEFRVNTFTAGDQSSPKIAALSGGGFVVTWTSNGQDGSGYGVYAQRYDQTGVAEGAEFRVNTFTAGDQSSPKIAALSGGGFVVTWISNGQAGSGDDVYAQRYDQAGVAQGTEFRANNYTVGSQNSSAITALAGGGFVLAWQYIDFGGFEVRGVVRLQRYDASGMAQGANIGFGSEAIRQISSGPGLTALDDGGFVATWTYQSIVGAASPTRLARRFDADGVPQGGVVSAASYPASDKGIAALSDGGFVKPGNSLDGSGSGVFAQRYDAAGNAVAATLSGDAGANTLAWTGTQSVMLNGGAGDDTLTGGTGIDTAVFSALASAYTISRNGLTTTVSGPDGTDTLTSIERLQFHGESRTLEHADRDFGANGHSDILLRSTNGNVAVWQMEGFNQSNGAVVGSASTDWKLVDGSGDYDGNGSSDLLWQNDNGFVAIWQMDGLTVSGGSTFSSVSAGWTIADGSGDYNGDGKSDVLLRHDNGNLAMWQMNGMAISFALTFSSVSADWKIADGSGDYNGDGKSDILLRHDNGDVAVWLMDGFNQISGAVVNSATPDWKIVDGSGDYNGDGKSDILWRNDNGNVAIWLMEGVNLISEAIVNSATTDWKIVDGSGDYDGNGNSDILWHNDNGNVGMWLMDGMVIATGATISKASQDWMIPG